MTIESASTCRNAWKPKKLQQNGDATSKQASLLWTPLEAGERVLLQDLDLHSVWRVLDRLRVSSP